MTQSAADLKTVRLVLVEDSDSDVFLLTDAAQQLSYDLRIRRFTTAPRAIGGLEDAMNDNPDGVLLDLNLPGGSGLDVLRAIRDSVRCSGLRVVVMTSSLSARDREAAERLGIQGYLIKSSDLNEFVSALDGVLRTFSTRS